MKINGIDLQPNAPVTLHGIVVFLRTNIGSKSEAKEPFLYINRDEKIRLMKTNDNPFENHGLDEYDGKLVEVCGKLIRNNVFGIVSIKEKQV